MSYEDVRDRLLEVRKGADERTSGRRDGGTKSR